ncbi:TPA: hypothetical protein HA335_01880 [Methanocaldococcus jannaschii]|uniref:Uncharacterized protein MJ0763 n=2 Tax=Methanocaldococcus jannaschii TaxID=2190 RepID=Y763_METJA|nr:hypothetical protein [Methanocaldococcus jannaschii]Q58173.1 RecName: Full=Uncharacterized protein MJ0763 [Methanocaldococcus jannaschii DSM 2661]AAB98759.1 hypothetical protein MJ_0763 [Methanocaldococcus jannaschii DSM 2661]HII59320.1 hypothetical protein [Methanocaldococcus jannaschii]
MDEIKEYLAKILENKIKISMIAKFKSVEEYEGRIFKDLFDVEMKNLEILYEKYLIYFNEKPNIKAEVDTNADVIEILKETIELEKFLAKKLGVNFGVRQAVIHALSDDERFLYFLTKKPYF